MGGSCLHRLRGMFAFAILDRGPAWGSTKIDDMNLPRSPYLFLARDRFGIKPLVYVKTGSKFAFASELKALMTLDWVKGTMRPEAVIEYLEYGAISQPETILNDVYQLEPGTAMYVSESGEEVSVQRYWDLADAVASKQEIVQNLDYTEQVQLIRELLEEATQYHLICDVAVGAFLSGGIDSTAVCALMQRMTDKPVQTFSIGFKGTTEVTDESSFAKEVATLLGCEHTEVIVDEKDIEASFDDVINSIDQPSIDGTNTYLVSQATTKTVKVAISGVGGDELFAGYPHFKAYQKAMNQRPSILDYGAAFLHDIRPNRFTYQSAYKAANRSKRLALPRNLVKPKQLRKQVKSNLVSWCQPYNHPVLCHNELPNWDALSQLSYAECRGYLQNTLLRDNDVMSMAHSLETRPVLLDHKLAEHAIALPPTSKIRNGQMKSALVDAVKDIIPTKCWNQPKQGFELPFATWMNSSLLSRVREVINSDSARQVFNTSYLQKIDKQAKKKTIPRKAWAWFVLFSWMEQTGCRLE